MFNQIRMMLAQIRANYNAIEQENEKLRKLYEQILSENKSLNEKIIALSSKEDSKSNGEVKTDK